MLHATRLFRLAAPLLALAACVPQPPRAGIGLCGAPPPEPGPGGCALVCRAVLPVSFANGVPNVVVWINEQVATLVVDTGAGSSFLTEAAARRLGLEAPTAAAGEVFGIGGPQPRREVQIRSLGLGALQLPARPIDVIAFGKPEHAPDGALGVDILSHYDLDLDLPHNLIRLYQGSACPGPPPGWRSAGMGVPFGSRFAGYQPVLPITLDGQPIQAVLDTGAGSSAVDVSFARQSQVSQAELASEPPTTSFGVGPSQASGRLHLFRSLQIGDETLKDFEADILALRLRHIEMLLGEDYIQQRKIWVSYGRREFRISSDW